MYLKSLTLKGFKSFADKSVFSVEPGVTCVVGPNGSGKSNISDAVLWVLGEQSARTLRGQAMEDVIFAGSSGRQAVGVAEVDLVLDNADSTLPLEFNEVTITRRMYRSGESEYLINQSPARLMDILDLLHDTGLGRDAHSIISQGRLTEVLNAKPEDRRALIEEAAGVLKHKKRKEKALRKLTGLDVHLERAKDVAHEIERQLKPLEKQAAKAKTHGELVEELRGIETALAVDDLRLLQSDWNRILKEEKEANGELEIIRFKLEEREREVNKYQHLLEEKGLFVGDINEQKGRVATVGERLDSGLLLLEEKGKNLVKNLSELRQQLHSAQARIGSARRERDETARRRAETDGKLKGLYTQLNEIRRESEGVRKERVSCDESYTKASQELRTARAKRDEAQAKASRFEKEIASLVTQTTLLENRREELGGQTDSAQEQLAARRARQDNLEGELKKIKQDEALADRDVDKRVRVLDSRRQTLEKAREAFSSARAEIKGLEEVDKAFESASPALARLIAKSDSLPGLIGPIADHIDAKGDAEQLVERLLGADLFGIFVEDDAAAVAAAREVKTIKGGEISIVPVNRSLKRVTDCKVGTPLMDMVTFDEKVAPGVATLFGDVYVVESLQTALASLDTYPHVRFATRDGVVVWPSGKVTLGKQIADNEGILAQKRRLNQLTDGLSGLENAVAEAEGDVSIAEEALTLAQQDAFGLNQKEAQVTGEYNSLLAEIARMEKELAGLTKEGNLLEERLSEVSGGLTLKQPTLEELNKQVELLEKEIITTRENMEHVDDERTLKVRDEEAINKRLADCNVEIATVSEREVHLKKSLDSLVNECVKLEDIIENHRITEKSLNMLLERIEPLHQAYEGMRERTDSWSLMLNDRAKVEQVGSESLRATILEAQGKVKSVQATIDEKSEALTTVRVRKGQMEVEVNAAVRHIVEEIGIPLETALALEEIDNRITVEDRAHTIRRKLSNLGAINSVAESEYESLKERRDFMHTQIEDLESARKALNKVVAAIDRKIKTLFVDTFEQVDLYFQKYFAVLFPGGTAELVLSDPDDPATSGVEFIAQPRGKRVKKMSLLSGGEQSLIALALLFAVNQVHPCPFFILDEVEAALDDFNLRAFVNFINTMRHETQFLIITHQRRTMEMADMLYGVSMQADGVSKLVSQKLEQALELVAKDEVE